MGYRPLMYVLGIDGYNNPMRPGPQFSSFRVGKAEPQRCEGSEQHPIGREWQSWAGSKPIRPQSPATILLQAPQPSARNDFPQAPLGEKKSAPSVRENEEISRRQLPRLYLAGPFSPRLSWDQLGNTEQGPSICWASVSPLKGKGGRTRLMPARTPSRSLDDRRCPVSCIWHRKA